MSRWCGCPARLRGGRRARKPPAKRLKFFADLPIDTGVRWFWIWILAAWAALAQTPGEQQRASVERQREAVRKQAETLGLWLLPWADGPPAAMTAACDPLADDVVAPLIETAAKTQQMDPKLVRAVIEQESGVRPCAVSPKGAQGLMQLMPETAGQLAVADPFDPQENIQGGTRYLKQLLEKYKGDLGRALAAYNAGPGAVNQANGIPEIPETQEYVDAILTKLGIKHTDPPHNPTPKPTEN